MAALTVGGSLMCGKGCVPSMWLLGGY
jgi:hypothetical protein